MRLLIAIALAMLTLTACRGESTGTSLDERAEERIDSAFASLDTRQGATNGIGWVSSNGYRSNPEIGIRFAFVMNDELDIEAGWTRLEELAYAASAEKPSESISFGIRITADGKCTDTNGRSNTELPEDERLEIVRPMSDDCALFSPMQRRAIYNEARWQMRGDKPIT